MFRHYLFTTCRNLWHRKLYSVITLLSLTIGLSIFSVIFLHVKWEFSYNRGLKDSGQIFQLYSVLAEGNPLAQLFGRSGALTAFNNNETADLDQFLADFDLEITRTSSLSGYDRSVQPQRYINIKVVDETFPDVFSLPVTAGDISQVFTAPGNIAISEAIAETIFGDNNAIGQRLELGGSQSASSRNGEVTVAEGDTLEFRIVAVFREPQPVTSDLGFTAIASRNDYTVRLSPNETISSSSSVWFKLNNKTDAKKIENDLKTYVDQYLPQLTGNMEGQARSEVSPYQLRSIHDIYFETSGDLVRVLSFALLGLMVMVAGCSNAVSLGFASALERRSEVGIRKSVGAERSHVMIQFLGEPIILALLSMIPVLVITGLYHPVFSQMLSFQELPSLLLSDYMLLGVVVLAVGLCIGFYPAFILSRLRPVQILRPETRRPGNQIFSLRSVMVGVQFSFAILLLVVTASLYAQLQVTRSVPLGFNPQNLARVYMSNETSDIGPEALKNLVSQMPGVTHVIEDTSGPSIGERNDSFTSFSRTIDATDIIPASSQTVPAGQFELYEIPLLAGREFDGDRDNIQNSSQEEIQSGTVTEKVLINRAMMKALLVETPEEAVGMRLYRMLGFGTSIATPDPTPKEVIGVVEDSMYGGIQSRPGPEVYTLSRDLSALMRAINSATQLTIRYEASLDDSFQKDLGDYLKQEANIDTMSVTFVEEIIRRAYLTEIRESRLLLLCGFLALVLSCSGLFGLVSISMKTRIKEVGIRKALGASSLSILTTILKSYSWPVLLANILAWPVAVYFVLQWIQGFPYQLDKIWLLPICLATSLLVLIIAWATVSLLTYKTASARPVLALRYE